ncbi:hypothetical protein Tco_0832435 [Tanacetum coccineum]
MKECYRALSDQLDWNNPEGNKCPYDLSKPLPLHESRGHLTVLVDFFFNNDLEYLRGGSTDKKYTTSITKAKATKYDIEGIEDMVPNLWSLIKVAYDKYAALGISHWGPKRQRFYGHLINRKSKNDVYSTMRILNVTSVTVEEWYGYGYLKEIVVRRAYQKLYKFMEGDFPWLHLNDIEDMLLLVAQNKLNNLDGYVIFHLEVGLRMYTQRIVIQAPYTSLSEHQGMIYEDKLKRKIFMRTGELYKFSDGTLTLVCNTLDQILKNLMLRYNKVMNRRKWTTTNQKQTCIMIKDIDQQYIRIMRILEKFVGRRDNGTDYRLLQWTVSILRSSQNQRDLPRDIPLDRIEVLRYDTKGVKVRKGIMQTKTKLTLEHTQQDVSDEVLVIPMLAAAGPRQVRLIATCSYSTDIYEDIMKAQVHVSKDFRYSDTARLP